MMSEATSPFSDFAFEKYGLGHLTAEQREAMIGDLHEELSCRVGQALSQGLCDAELAEFEAFMDRVPGFSLAWLEVHAPGFRTEAAWSGAWRTLEATSPTVEVAYAEMASMVWLQVKRPNAREVVARIHADIVREVDETFNASNAGR